jgi:diguanylate cyclase (GGDEF)-like protein
MQGLHALQREILESLAIGKPLEEAMTQLCRQAEKLAPDVICSVLSVDRDGRLHTVAAPSLPQHYSAAIDGMRTGPDAGCCGAAAYLGEPVESTDIASDPRWAEFKDLALPIGLRACWSSPIRASDGRVVGTFAFYYRTCRGASPLDETIVATCLHLCAIALEQEERKASIHRLAYYDSVTGIANRAGLERYGARAVAAAIEKGRGVAVHCFDLDNFKEVNDTLGHHAGDMLLRTVAERVSAVLGPDDFFARVGGDEFVVVQGRADSTREIEEFAARLIAAMSAALELEDATATIGASIGIACAPDHGCDLPELMRKADLAMHEAKTSGRGRFRVFDARIESQIAADRQTRRELRRAIIGNELDLHFQPIVDLRLGEISGFEALVRWRHPGDGVRLPSQFLPVAEKAGLMDEIGDWVLRRACALAASFPSSTRLCVNLSPSQLEKPDFAFQVAKAIAASGLSPKQLELEITESTLLVENAATSACLSDIRALGVSIALDDFGTGCSALSHLRVFPVDRIKIDRSFVQEAVVRPETASIVRTIVALARDLGLKTTAEGVETDAQLRMLRDFGCDEIQGYLVSPPRPIEAFIPNPFAIGSEAGPWPLAEIAEAFQGWVRPLAEKAIRSERSARRL